MAEFNDFFLKFPCQDFGKNPILAIHHRKVTFCFLGTAWDITVVGLKTVRGWWHCDFIRMEWLISLHLKKFRDQQKLSFLFENLGTVFTHSTSDIKCMGLVGMPSPPTPLTLKGGSLIPGQDTYSDCGFHSYSGPMGEATDHCFLSPFLSKNQ